MWYLIQMYNDSIARSTNSLNGRSKDGVYGLLERVVAEDDDLELTFITFNQDLMIEKALARFSEKRKRGPLPFSLDKCYGIAFQKFSGTTGYRKEFPIGRDVSVPIIKLHGSLNWEYFVRSDKDPKNLLRTPRIKNLVCSKAEKLLLYATWRPKGRSRAGRLIPVVVPPIYEKSTVYEMLLSPLRERAAVALQEAERLIIFGYSFPDADFMAQSLIRRSMNRNRALKDLVIINPDPFVCAKAADLSNSETLFYAKNVRVKFGNSF